ncbi:MAG: hypothetical protein ABIE03_03080 [Patescibacteria group bacterium]|nr:hypothetical protein [Patescibacteria group bacterium]
MNTIDLMMNSQKICTVRRMLALPDTQSSINQGKDLAVGVPARVVSSIIRSAQTSKWQGCDRRKKSGKIGFLKYGFYKNFSGLSEMIWESGLVGSKKLLLDKDRNISKVVFQLVIKAKGSNKVLLVPRAGKTILSNAFTLGFTKSMSIESLRKPFDATGRFRYGRNQNLKPDEISLFGEVGIFPQIEMISYQDIVTSGVVAGGKDFGLVYIAQTHQAHLESLACSLSGIVFDAEEFSYLEVTKYFGIESEGWSEAIDGFLHDSMS